MSRAYVLPREVGHKRQTEKDFAISHSNALLSYALSVSQWKLRVLLSEDVAPCGTWFSEHDGLFCLYPTSWDYSQVMPQIGSLVSKSLHPRCHPLLPSCASLLALCHLSQSYMGVKPRVHEVRGHWRNQSAAVEKLSLMLCGDFQ